MEMVTINWLAVFAASLSSFVIGAVWFGPKTFYPLWMKALGRPWPIESTEPPRFRAGEDTLLFGGTYVAALVQVITLAVCIGFVRNSVDDFGAISGAALGFALAVGFGAFGSLSHRLFGQADHKGINALKVWLIEVGQDVVALTVAGAILGAWT
jgi:hypothetical protein